MMHQVLECAGCADRPPLQWIAVLGRFEVKMGTGLKTGGWERVVFVSDFKFF